MSKKTSDNYVYLLDGRAYVNLTNRCHNACGFCIRNTGDGVAGTPLWLNKEPTADEVILAFQNVKNSITDNEVVFCGYGEPTEKLGTLIECAARLKSMGYKLRLNTNGLGELVNGKNIAPLLKDFDTVSVSLNESNADKYAQITKSAYGRDAFDAVVKFAKSCKNEGIPTVFTVVDTIGDDAVEECKKIAESVGVQLRVRRYVADNYGEGK